MTSLDTTVKDTLGKTIDPVCGMNVEPGKTNLVSVHKGHSYWFCADACRRAFKADPDKYLKPEPSEKKGWFGRWLDRMAKSNKEEFGCHGPKCCH
jgi:YHS domain-containing protein